MGAELLGVENHNEQIRQTPEYSYRLIKNPKMLAQYHASLAVANRLQTFLEDVTPPAMIDVPDLADGALQPPFPMIRGDALALLRYIRKALQSSPIVKIEITPEREVILLGFVYQESVGKSILAPVGGSAFSVYRRAS